MIAKRKGTGYGAGSTDTPVPTVGAASISQPGGRNYLGLSDVFILFAAVLYQPVWVIPEFTYKVAKRRSRANWPQVVRERLDPNGPTERLIDLERNSGTFGGMNQGGLPPRPAPTVATHRGRTTTWRRRPSRPPSRRRMC